MRSASRAFADERREQLFRDRPQAAATPDIERPWHTIQSAEMPPLMLQLRFRNGQMVSYAYGDLREIRYRDAGYLQLGIYGLSRVLVTIEGRHLRELAEALGCGLVRWLAEGDDLDRPEAAPAITSIVIEPIAA